MHFTALAEAVPACRKIGPSLVALLVLVGTLGGCSQKSPEEKVSELRSRYHAEVNQGGFYVKREPVVEPVAVELEGGELAGLVEPEVADEAAMAEEAEIEPPVVLYQDVVLDILLRHDSSTKLPGITLDVVMDGADGSRKGHWLVWVDTSTLEKGNHQQFSHEVRDVEYEEGDGFSVEVRHPIPPEERGDYREFQGLS